MGISLSIPFDPCVNKISHWLDEKVGSTQNLEKNLAALETAMEDLKAKRDDLSTRLTREENRGLQRLAESQVWLTRVETIETKVNDLLVARIVQLQKLCLCGFCCKNPISSYRYGKSVFLTLKEVKELERRVFDVIAAEQVQTIATIAAEQAQTSEVQEKQLQSTIVGQEIMLDKAWRHLKEDGVGIMGMYGLGGVGKTTLLKQLNNRFSGERSGFEFVIWVVVSKELHIEKIQDEIAEKVGLGGEEWKRKEKSQKTDVIFNFLRKKRFVLFLDDIWEKVDFVEIGIPFPTKQNGCKTVFTTRDKAVCAHMGVEDPMEVRCLAENEAFDLFQKKVGQITLGSDPEIPNLARIVAKKCCGLPLALNVIGETMSCKRTVQEWRHAIDVLTSYAADFSGMEDKILPILKYSYDNIKREHVKSCLLYCALFPEDSKIPRKGLIDYWICEGLIDGSGGIEMAENKGYEIIASFVRASLLMEAEWWDKDNVCMHDVVREMVLWIATDLGIQKGAFIVRAGVKLDNLPKVENWCAVRRMSLVSNNILQLVGSPECLELKTLLMKRNMLKRVASEFFVSMPKLVVLDLSQNRNLSELPDGISELVSLQYLNLSSTGIRHLPMGLQKLKKLIHLDLEGTSELSSIVGISKLHNLKVLKLCCSGCSWDLGTVEELETLEHLEILTTRITSLSHKILSSHKLLSCTPYLHIKGMNLKSSGISLTLTMDKLRYILISECSISEIRMGRICIESKTFSPLQSLRNPCFSSLSKVAIMGCKFLRELTWLMFAPNLKDLALVNVYLLEDIINKEKAVEGERSGIVPFEKLIDLQLSSLPKLKNIHWRPLPLPRLKKIDVGKCPNLKKLPLDSKSGMHGDNGLVIKYKEKEWIKAVEWEDEATKTRFTTSCEKEPSLSFSLQQQDVAKQIMVVKVNMRCDKCRQKALRTSTEQNGVTAVWLNEEDREKLWVEGHQVDVSEFVNNMREKVGYTEILYVPISSPFAHTTTI